MSVSATSVSMAIAQQRGVATSALLASIFVAALFAALILATGWPAQIRIDSPRLGTPWIDRSGAMMMSMCGTAAAGCSSRAATAC